MIALTFERNWVTIHIIVNLDTIIIRNGQCNGKVRVARLLWLAPYVQKTVL